MIVAEYECGKQILGAEGYDVDDIMISLKRKTGLILMEDAEICGELGVCKVEKGALRGCQVPSARGLALAPLK